MIKSLFSIARRLFSRKSLKIGGISFSALFPLLVAGQTIIREEKFDREPANWEGINNRNIHFERKIVTQDFGYAPSTNHAGGARGEVGGRIHPAGESAFYGYRLPVPRNLNDSLSASGKIFVATGAGHFLLGFFNENMLNEWRTPNTMAVRINGRGDFFYCHIEYSTSRWRSNAGIIGEISPGGNIQLKEMPSGQCFEWRMEYDPKGADGWGMMIFSLNGETAKCSFTQDHRRDAALFTHFGIFPIPKTWDSPSEAWIDDVEINGEKFDFSQDPYWDQKNNRCTYETKDTRPRFDFGWSPTQWAGGLAPGELGGLIFRGDCRDPKRMAAYGDQIGKLTLDAPIFARGKICMIRGVSDSTASLGFYNSAWSLRSNSAQNQSIPMDYLGVNIEGPSSEGFFFYPVYRVHGDISGALSGSADKMLRIYPDRQVHEWSLQYDPEGANGRGLITVHLNDRSCVLELEPNAKTTGAFFDRFGICTPWIDGNSVTVFFDDLQYVCGQSK